MSSSILTNMSAMTAVQNLAATQKSLATVQNEISTGLAVSSAQDNAAYYSIAQTMRTNVSNLSAVTSSLNLGSSVLATATSATGQITSILQSISSDLVSAKGNVGDATSQGYLQTAISSLNKQLASIVGSASFNGTNLLNGSAGAAGVSFVSGVTGTGANTAVTSLTIDTSGTNLNGAVYVKGTNSLVDQAVAADVAANTAAANNSAALANLNSALGGNASSLSNVFGGAASIDANGKVTGIVAGSLGAKLLGSTASTYTFNASSQSGTDAPASPAAAAQTAFNKLAAQFNTTNTTGASITASGSMNTAFVAAFGANATLANGVVSGISLSSTAGAILGATGSSYTLSTLSGSTYLAGTTASDGTLATYLGTAATDTSTAANTNGGAVATANTKDNAARNDATANAIYGGALFSVGQISLGAGTTASQIDAYIQQVGKAVTAVNTASEQLGAASGQMTLQSTYISSLSDSLTSGVGSLVDADMNEASTRLSALQTQQQLGVQALSVANQNSQLILKLFGG